MMAQHQVDERGYPDSLQQILKSTTDLKARTESLFLLSDYWSGRDTAKALNYARESIALSRPDEYYTALGHFYLAGVYFEFDAIRSQQEYLHAEKLLSRFKTRDALIYRSRAWNNYGALEQRKDNSREYIEILLNKALPLAQQAGDSVRVALDYLNIGLIFLNLSEHAKALEYFPRATAIMESIDVQYADLADAYVLTAKAHILNSEYELAKPFLDKAKKILRPNPESPYLALYYCVEGMYQHHINAYGAAHESLQKGLELATRLNLTFDKRAILYEQYQVYKSQKNYPAAKAVLLKGYEQEAISPLSKNRRQLLFDLAETEMRSGNQEQAYRWLMQYSQLSDSIYSQQTKTDIAALEAKFRTAEKEKQILSLEHEKMISARDRKYQLLLFLSVIAVLLLVAVLAIMQLLHRKKLASKREAEHHATLERIDREKQLSNFSALMEGQEQERRRVARDLHDGLGCRLSAVKLGLSRIQAENMQQEQSLLQVSDQLDISIRELRWISRNMMPESLLTLGLQDALKDLCGTVMSPQLRMVFNSFDIDPQLPLATQTMIYRMVQEIIINAVNHAGASVIMLQCTQADGRFYITVEDNGIGFDTLQQNVEGIGLKNIRNRVDFLQGNINIDSSPEGTIINIELNVAS